MQIESLILTDYRVYAGRHEFNLAPRKRYGKVRPIVLFGGLNGAGKTSILSAVRVALYGRSAYGQRVSQRSYERILLESIHRPRGANQVPKSASIEITFTYAKLGTENTFKITRSWEQRNTRIKEHLRILEDGHPIKGLDKERAQNFLNELIPIGVSDLFFFDGEKISQLADNTGGAVLEQSIKNLLGLDVVERLSGDLTVLGRQLTRSSASVIIENKIEHQQQVLEQHRLSLESVRQKISLKATQIAEKNLIISQLRNLLNNRGTSFTTTRQELESELGHVNGQLQDYRLQASSLIADALPLSLADTFFGRTLKQINLDQDAYQHLQEQALMEMAFGKLIKGLTKNLSREDLLKVRDQTKLITRSFNDGNRRSAIVHDYTPSQAKEIFSAYEVCQRQHSSASRLFQMIEKLEKRSDEIVAALSRAPDDETIKDDFEQLQLLQHELGGLESDLVTLKVEAKSIASQALETAKILDKLYSEASKSSDQRRVLEYIVNSNMLLSDFVTKTAIKKIRELEKQFTQCFTSLARKGDLSLSITIDPMTYNVTLMSEGRRQIGEEELSAGEKQIFAISMLEALAKTSGRQLPMIVDTPLGRLDSKHRQRLIESYFPKASHQMIILSTDTEVDESFYRSLSSEISRAYKLDYEPTVGATSVEEGYFWHTRNGDV